MTPTHSAGKHVCVFALCGGRCSDHLPELYSWSVLHPEEFWPKVWSFFGMIASDLGDGRQWDEVVRGLGRMAPPDRELGPRWFLGARLNFAENLLRYRDDRDAIVAWNETGRTTSLSYAELYREVARVAAALRGQGIEVGDRVAGFMPNVPEAIVAMLAAASLGAVWSSCSPDFGAQGVLDRFGQIEPRVCSARTGIGTTGRKSTSAAVSPMS